VHCSNWGIIIKPPFAGRIEEFVRAIFCVRAHDAAADLVRQPGSNLLSGFLLWIRHQHMLSRRLTKISIVPDDASELVEGENAGGGWLPPRWILVAVVLFWVGSVVTDVVVLTWSRVDDLVLLLVLSLFFSLAIEPGTNWLVRRGWRRGRATLLIIFGVLVAIGAFLGAMGTLIGTQIADLLSNLEVYISDTVERINNWFGTSIDAAQVIDQFNDPNGAVQNFISAQRGDALRLTGRALNGLFATFSIVLFTFYFVADGPRMRRSICSRLRPSAQVRVLRVWELAIDKTGGYLYSRLLLSAVSAVFHGIVFASADVRSPIALALWVGLISQFLPVIGTYFAAVLPVVITFLDSPIRALVVFGIIIVYQQFENYVISPKVTARTMELHPAIAFGAALAGLSILGPSGALLALPVAAMGQAIASETGRRHATVDSGLLDDDPREDDE
jgi:predicted PurR-regulated permease PerM